MRRVSSCAKPVATKLGFNSADAEFGDGEVRAGNRRAPLAQAAKDGAITAEDKMEYGDLSKRFEQQTFGAHFCEVAVDAYTGEIRIRRMLAVCASGRILNPITARSQVIGGMVGGAGAALMEELAIDKRFGFFGPTFRNQVRHQEGRLTLRLLLPCQAGKVGGRLGARVRA